MIRSSIVLFGAVLALGIGACSKVPKASPEAIAEFPNPMAAQVVDAIEANSSSRVTALLKSGADVNAVGAKGRSLLELAVFRDKKDAFDALLAGGPDLKHVDDEGNSVTHYAATTDDASFLTALLAKKVDINEVNKQSGDSPLMMAVVGGHGQQVHALIAAGANINVAEPTGDTALMIAAQTNGYPLVLDLLNAGADPLAKDNGGLSFQRYLHLRPDSMQSAESKRQISQINDWLTAHNVAVEKI